MFTLKGHYVVWEKEFQTLNYNICNIYKVMIDIQKCVFFP